MDLDLSGGYFIIDNLKLAFGLGITLTAQGFDGDDDVTNGLSFGPSLSYSIPLGENVYLPISKALTQVLIKMLSLKEFV